MQRPVLLGLTLLLLPLGLYGLYSQFRFFHTRNEVMRVTHRINEQRARLGPHYPDRVTTSELRAYGIAMETTDVSRTPEDFQAAFREWAACWRAAADALDGKSQPRNPVSVAVLKRTDYGSTEELFAAARQQSDEIRTKRRAEHDAKLKAATDRLNRVRKKYGA